MKPTKARPTPPKKSTNQKALLTALLVFILVSASCASGFTAFAVSQQITVSLPGLGQIAGPQIANGAATPSLDAEGNPLPIGSGLNPVEVSPSLKPWDGAGRVTILLLGLDYRDWAADEGPSRSDTMILLTLDPLTKTAGMLSIPRDLWASIPGFKHGKINTAYYLGDAYKLPGGGPALAVKTVEELLGVPINYYAQIDFDAFVRFIDEIGGVEIDVPAKITIDLVGGGPKTKKKLDPGRQVLPGAWALAYARARYTEGGDFDRAARQQQVIMAIRDRMLSPNALPTIISRAPTLYNELAAGVHTNLSLDQVIQLALLAQTVPDENIQRGIIGKESVIFGTSPDGLSILIPLPDKIHALRDQVFASTGSLGPETPGSLPEQMKAEGAKIALFNASSDPNLLNRAADYLRGQGANIAQTAASGEVYASTTIIDHTGNPYILKYLVDLMHVSPGKIYLRFDPNVTADVEVYLGNDWAAQNP